MLYATRQRKRLLEILELHFDETLTVEQISSYVGDSSISRSAIYRNLAALETEGMIKRITLPAPQKTGYRFVGAKDCKKHLHLSCTLCGKTYHLPLPASDALIEGVMRDSDFQIDAANTVLTGICGKCRKN